MVSERPRGWGYGMLTWAPWDASELRLCPGCPGSSGALSAGADPYLLNLLYNGAYQAQPLPAETFSAQQLYQQQCQARQAGDAARQHAGLQLGGFGLPAALPGGGALYGMPSVHAPHAAVPLASERVRIFTALGSVPGESASG